MSDETGNIGNQMAHMRGEFSGLKELVTVRFDNLAATLETDRKASDKAASLLKNEVDHNRASIKQLDLATAAMLKDKVSKDELAKVEAELKLKAYQSAHEELRADFDTHVKEEAKALQGRIEKYDAIIKNTVLEATKDKLESKDWRFLTVCSIVFGFVGLLLLSVAGYGISQVVKGKDDKPAVVQRGPAPVTIQSPVVVH